MERKVHRSGQNRAGQGRAGVQRSMERQAIVMQLVRRGRQVLRATHLDVHARVGLPLAVDVARRFGRGSDSLGSSVTLLLEPLLRRLRLLASHGLAVLRRPEDRIDNPPAFL